MSEKTIRSPPSSLPAQSDKHCPSVLPQSRYPSLVVKRASPLPPISGYKHPAPLKTTPVMFYPPPPEFCSPEDDLPEALVHPDMPFNTVTDLDTPRLPLPPQPIRSPPAQPTDSSRSSIADSTSSEQTRDAVMEMMAMFSSSAPTRKRYTASQIAQRKAEEEYYKQKIEQEPGRKEICLIRYEQRQGWLGFWNRGNVLDIIDDLRELRSPKS